MANTNRAFGMRLVGTMTGAESNLAIKRFRIPASDGTATFIGDPVKILTGGTGLAAANLNQVDGLPQVIRAAASGDLGSVALAGVIVGFAFDPTNLNNNYRLASTDRDCFVCVDPNAVYEIQGDVTGIAAANASQNTDITMTAGSTVTGQSAAVAKVGALGTTATAPLRVIGFVHDASNDVTSAPYCRVHVKINNHFYGAATGTAGV